MNIVLKMSILWPQLTSAAESDCLHLFVLQRKIEVGDGWGRERLKERKIEGGGGGGGNWWTWLE